MENYSSLFINKERFRKRFAELSKIGATKDGGVHRPAFGGNHILARKWFLNEATKAGLRTSVDKAGNHSAILEKNSSHTSTLLLGSHLDSVPYGGRFDGALGVVAALEVLQTIKDQNIPLKYNLEAIDFTDEEGRFVGLLGSQAITGLLQKIHLENPAENYENFKRWIKLDRDYS